MIYAKRLYKISFQQDSLWTESVCLNYMQSDNFDISKQLISITCTHKFLLILLINNYFIIIVNITIINSKFIWERWKTLCARKILLWNEVLHDNWWPICNFMEFSIFSKMGVVATTFLKLEIYRPRLTHKCTIYHTRNFGIEFGQNRLERLIFFRFWFFWEFS